jgi:hypothetical protein
VVPVLDHHDDDHVLVEQRAEARHQELPCVMVDDHTGHPAGWPDVTGSQ